MTLTNSDLLPRPFARLAWSNLAAQSAEQVALAAAPIVAVLAIGADAGEAGLLQAVQSLPFLLLALPAGLLADSMPRRRLMAMAEAARALSLLAIVALATIGALTLPLLAALGFVGACGTVAYGVCAPALVPALVAPSQLAAANGRIELARTGAFLAGPALAGVLVGWAGAGAAFAVAAVLSLYAAILMVTLAEPPRQVAPRRPVAQELRAGAAFVLSHPLLRPVLLTQLAFNAAFFVLMAVYVPYAVARLGLSASGVGATLSCYGAGMVAGALLAGRALRRMAFGAAIAVGPLSGLAAAVAMVLTIWVPSPVIAGASFFLLGAGPIVWVVATTTLRQALTPPEMLGRASAMFMLATGARPVGAAVAALIASRFGPEACLVSAAAGFFVQALLILASPVLQLAQQPSLAPANPRAAPSCTA